jgi:hypothetical protein
MAFYSPDPAMDQALIDLVHHLESRGRPGLGEHLSLTWLRFAGSQMDRAAQLEHRCLLGAARSGFELAR